MCDGRGNKEEKKSSRREEDGNRQDINRVWMQNKGNTRIINLLLVSVGEKESQQMTPKREVWLSNPSFFLHLICPTKPVIVILVAVMHDLHRRLQEESQGNDTRDLLTKEGHKQQTKE